MNSPQGVKRRIEMKVAAFARYGPMAASSRQRLLQYIPHLRAAGIEVEWHALLDDAYIRSLGTGEAYPKWRIAQAYLRRLQQLRSSAGADLLWVYADLFPYLPARFERAVAGSGTPIVYDFDDAFFHRYDDSPSPLVRHLLGGKFAELLRDAAACCCGNTYVRDYAAQYCPNSIVIPTVVDTNIYRPLAKKVGPAPLVIGWVGSPTTWPNVRPLLTLLRELCADGRVRMKVVGAGSAAKRDRFPGLELVEWSQAGEVAQVQTMDIGIMPLADLPFERGKSGYKLIQYMACGVPAVASPVGANIEILANGRAGILAASEDEWRDALVGLIDEPAARAKMGRTGRERVEECYSLSSQAPRLIEVLEAVTGQKAATDQ
jgi:glycosyltransferase involved in cell wall biosynthesis